MNKCTTTFRKGLHVFWDEEFRPMVLELISMIGDFLKFIAYLLFGFWIVLTFSWLLFSPLKNTPHWVDYLGVGSLFLQAITAAVLFIRHVLRLGNKGDTR